MMCALALLVGMPFTGELSICGLCIGELHGVPAADDKTRRKRPPSESSVDTIEICADMSIDMCIDMFVDMGTVMCKVMHMNTRMDLCIDMCRDMGMPVA